MSLRQLLLIRSSQPENNYGRFLSEILKSEGLSDFETVDIDTESFPDLRSGDLVILSRCFLRYAEIDALYNAVKSGVRLVCLQPSWELAKRLGWNAELRASYPGWIKVRKGYPGEGLPLQVHAPVSCYTAADDVEYEAIADAVTPDWEDENCPAVVRLKIGDGEAVIFFYDLSEAVARIRFGNPELASYLTNRYWGFSHPCDLFEGHIDDRVIHIPQADMHCQLLAKALTDICPYPLARLWYYPESDNLTIAVFESDDDMSTPEQFAELADMLKRHDAHGSFYLMEQTLLPDAAVEEMRNHGHSFGPHVAAADGVEALYFRFQDAIKEQTEKFVARYGSHSATIQTHCTPWLGYLSWVRHFTENGYRLIFPFMSIPRERICKYMCGSGRPMRFYDRDGVLYDCYQQPETTYDDASLVERITREAPVMVAEFKEMLDRSISDHHTSIALLSHPVSFATYSRPFIEPCFDLLKDAGVPVYNGDEWVDFLDRRDAVKVAQKQEGDRMICTVTGLRGRLPLMFPIEKAGGLFTAAVDDAPVEPTTVNRLKERYLIVQLEGKPDARDISVEFRRL